MTPLLLALGLYTQPADACINGMSRHRRVAQKREPYVAQPLPPVDGFEALDDATSVEGTERVLASVGGAVGGGVIAVTLLVAGLQRRRERAWEEVEEDRCD